MRVRRSRAGSMCRSTQRTLDDRATRASSSATTAASPIATAPVIVRRFSGIALGTAIDPRQQREKRRPRDPERPSRQRLPTCRESISAAGRARGNTTLVAECRSRRSDRLVLRAAARRARRTRRAASTSEHDHRDVARTPGTGKNGVGDPVRRADRARNALTPHQERGATRRAARAPPAEK